MITGTLTTHPLGAETVIRTTSGGVSVETWPSLGVTAAVLGVGLAAFLVGARAWRALP